MAEDTVSSKRRRVTLLCLLRVSESREGQPGLSFLPDQSTLSSLGIRLGLEPHALNTVVEGLISEGLVYRSPEGLHRLTDQGLATAKELRKERLPHPKRILCIDTEPETVAWLKDVGHDVFPVEMGYRTGTRRFDYPPPHEVDAIICDLRLPACFDSSSWGPYGKNDNFKCEIVPPEQMDDTYSMQGNRLIARYQLIQESQLGPVLPGTFGPKDVQRAIAKGGIPFLLMLNGEWLSRAHWVPNWVGVTWEFNRTTATKIQMAPVLENSFPELGREIKFKLAIGHLIEKGPLGGGIEYPINSTPAVFNSVGDVFGQVITLGKGEIWLIPETHSNPELAEVFATRASLRKPIPATKAAAPISPVRNSYVAQGNARQTTEKSVSPSPAGVPIDVFISHSSKDTKIAEALIKLLRAAITGLDPARIRCTGVPAYKLPGGAETDRTLKSEVLGARVFVGLLTHDSLQSTYVLFELGARWGVELILIPLVASSMTTAELKEPLKGLNALSCNEKADLHALIGQLAKELSLSKVANPALYEPELLALVEVSGAAQQTISPALGLAGGIAGTSHVATSLKSFLNKFELDWSLACQATPLRASSLCDLIDQAKRQISDLFGEFSVQYPGPSAVIKMQAEQLGSLATYEFRRLGVDESEEAQMRRTVDRVLKRLRALTTQLERGTFGAKDAPAFEELQKIYETHNHETAWNQPAAQQCQCGDCKAYRALVSGTP